MTFVQNMFALEVQGSVTTRSTISVEVEGGFWSDVYTVTYTIVSFLRLGPFRIVGSNSVVLSLGILLFGNSFCWLLVRWIAQSVCML